MKQLFDYGRDDERPDAGAFNPFTESEWEFLEEEEEYDTIEEVDAVFRAQRRLSFRYGALFFLITLSIPLLTATSDYWRNATVWGGFTLNYLTVAVLYHIFYVMLGLAYAHQANKLEDELLGRRDYR